MSQLQCSMPLNGVAGGGGSRRRRSSSASLSSSTVGADPHIEQSTKLPQLPETRPAAAQPPSTLYRTLRRCRPCAKCGDFGGTDDGLAFASFDNGREAILPVGCTSTQTFTSNCTTTTSTKKTTNSSINQSRKTTSTDHHSSPAWHADCSR